MIHIYQSKERPWSWIVLRRTKYEKSFGFNIRRVPNNYWLKRPRFFINAVIGIVSYFRNNSFWSVGIGVGKNQFVLIRHH